MTSAEPIPAERFAPASQPRPSPVPRYCRIALLVLSALAAAAFSAYATQRYGPGLSPDSIVYLDAARNLHLGRGVYVPEAGYAHLQPLTHFPPLYPLILSLAPHLRASFLHAARDLNLLLAAVNVLLIAELTRRAVGGIWPPVVAALLAAASVDLFVINSFVYTEPLALALGSAAMLALHEHLMRPAWRWLLLAALLAAAACLTRYAGVALVGAGAAGIVLLSTRTLARRVFDAMVFGAPSGAALLAWMLRNRRLAGTVASRLIVWHVGSAIQFQTLGITLRFAIIPRELFAAAPFAWIAVGVLALAMVLFAFRARRQPAASNSQPTDVRLCVLLLLLVLGHTVLSMVVLEPSMPLDLRLMAPAYVPGLVLAVALFALLARRSPRFFPAALGGVLIVAHFAAVCVAAAGFHRDGSGFSGRRWADSPVIASLQSIDRTRVIYSNAPNVVLYYDSLRNPHEANRTRRRVAWLPSAGDAAGLAKLDTALKKGTLVLYAPDAGNDSIPLPMLRQQIPLRTLQHDTFGVALLALKHKR